jgi:hypothetical protein
MWLSLFVWASIGRLDLVPAAKERNEVEEAVGDIVLRVSSSSSESTGLNAGEEVGLRFEIRSSLMLRCLRMGLQGRGLRVDEQRSSRTCAEGELGSSMLSGTASGLGGGVQSTAVCRGPYSHVTSESFNLLKMQ